MPLIRFLPEDTHIDFVKARYWAFAIDGLLVLATIISIAIHGFNYGIDFTGGVLMEVKAPQTIDIAQIRSQVDSLGFNETQIQYFGGGECDKPVNSCVLVRVQPRANEVGETVSNKIKAKLGKGYNFRRAEVVGPKVSAELLNDGILATVLAIIAIAIWVAVRFEWQYGIAAAIATGHDVLVTAGLYSLLHMEFDLNAVAALLTLAGYSINDTVVVFDRIRENRRRYKRMPLGELINLSTNQMLTRTILTSAATAMAILPMLLYGGPTLFNLTAAILFGIVVGTFSSTYVAAALLLYLPARAGTRSEESAAAAP
ncbi:MAG TPA: protein translocase subunit SecF [Rhizomicrobium sp.]|nr:protein translocase subunit SecF [Rhizomicrobium sp.]